ncbi:hypothetical protein BDV3_006922 [Batrachochytrium dendrobatidis]
MASGKTTTTAKGESLRRSRRDHIADSQHHTSDHVASVHKSGLEQDSTENYMSTTVPVIPLESVRKRRQDIGSSSTANGTSRKILKTIDANSQVPVDTASNSMYPLHGQGSIVRIKLTNFLTYSAVEFYPGPNLNMVVGPNGTGKSTVVCAIALGLCGRPDVLGRARELQDFVKHGENKAIVEIELKVTGKKLVITRTFERGSNQSSWKINGLSAKEKEIKAEIEALAIQVDNLCQFLPQERVSGFAQLSSTELLKETERAVGGTQMVEWHNFLIEQHEKRVEHEQKLKDCHAELEILQKRNQHIENDVQRIKERDKINSEIRLLTVRLAKLDFITCQTNYREAKEAKQRLQEEFNAIANQEQPLREEQENLRRKVTQLDQTVQSYKSSYSGEANRCRVLVEEAEAKSEEIETILNEIQHAKSEKQKQQREFDRLKMVVEQVREKLEEQRIKLAEYGITPGDSPGVFIDPPLQTEEGIELDGSQLNFLSRIYQQAQACNHRIAENAERAQENNSKKNEVAREAAEVRVEQQKKATELEQLDQIRHRKLAALKRGDKDAYNATMWLQDNLSMFEKHVFEPICMEVNLKDTRYAAVLETLVKPSHNTTFVTQCKQDYNRFCEEVISIRKWRVNVVYFDRPLSSWTPEHPRQLITQLGFDGYALDFIDGPEPILSALCQMCFLHTNAIALGKLPDLVAAEKKLRVFIANNDLYSVKHAYGHTSTRAKRIANPRYLDLSVDIKLKTRLEQEQQEIMAQLQVISETSKQLEMESSKIRELDQELREEKASLKQKRMVVNSIKQEYSKISAILESRLNSQIAAHEAAQQNQPPNAQEVESKLKMVCRERVRLATRLSEVYSSSCDIFLARTKATLVKMQSTARIDDLDDIIRSSNEQNAERARALDQAKQELQHFKTVCRQALNRHNAEVDKLSQKEAEQLDGFEETLISDDIAAQIGALTTRAEIIAGIDPKILQDYEARIKEIECLSLAIKERETTLNALSTNMATIKENWTTSLQDIVNRISENFSNSFETLGCAGEVQIAQNDDYAKWGIEIRVKFRDDEPLQVLTSTRQSGGERSVSTMLYLIALQHLSQSPFRVVDEINQGMDPRNERNVHKLIVQAACLDKANSATVSSQYFLITPKLLHDLEYHRNMTILCIYNGTWQPKQLNLASYITKHDEP